MEVNMCKNCGSNGSNMPSKRSPAPVRGDRVNIGQHLGAKASTGSLGRIGKKAGGKRGGKKG